MSVFYFIDHTATSVDYSNITDLAVVMAGGQAQLVATTLFDGTLTRWDLDGAGITLADAVEYDGGLRAGGTGSIMQINLDGAQALLTGGGANGGLQTHTTNANGQFTGSYMLGADAALLAGLTHGATITLGNGNQAVYGGLAGADVTDVATIAVGDAQFMLAASGTENGILSVVQHRQRGCRRHHRH
ncbi:MAG: hypothetical protein ACI91Z_000027 [Yoonia sp.]|jgi:hypothetical protein